MKSDIHYIAYMTTTTDQTSELASLGNRYLYFIINGDSITLSSSMHESAVKRVLPAKSTVVKQRYKAKDLDKTFTKRDAPSAGVAYQIYDAEQDEHLFIRVIRLIDEQERADIAQSPLSQEQSKLNAIVRKSSFGIKIPLPGSRFLKIGNLMSPNQYGPIKKQINDILELRAFSLDIKK